MRLITQAPFFVADVDDFVNYHNTLADKRNT